MRATTCTRCDSRRGTEPQQLACCRRHADASRGMCMIGRCRNCAAGASPMSDVTEFLQLLACGTAGVTCNSQAVLQYVSARVLKNSEGMQRDWRLCIVQACCMSIRCSRQVQLAVLYL